MGRVTSWEYKNKLGGATGVKRRRISLAAAREFEVKAICFNLRVLLHKASPGFCRFICAFAADRPHDVNSRDPRRLVVGLPELRHCPLQQDTQLLLYVRHGARVAAAHARF